MGLKHLDTLAEFNAALKAAGKKLVVVDFAAVWCGPCKRLAPQLEALAKKTPDALFYKVDVDENSETAEKYEITGMPTIIFFKNGKKVATVVGANFSKIEATVTANL